MKTFKKIYAVFSSVLIFSTNFLGVKALFGNSHFSLGQRIIEKSKVSISETEKDAFLSGIVYADIGRFKFDKQMFDKKRTYIHSDSTKFVEEMKKHAKTSEEKWFIKGFEAHILQDSKTPRILEDVLNYGRARCGLEYVKSCGFLDYYFMNKNKSYISNEFLSKFNIDQVAKSIGFGRFGSGIRPETKENYNKIVSGMFNKHYDSISKNSLVIYDELIKKTYESLGLKVSNEQIHEQAGNIMGAFVLSSSPTFWRNFGDHICNCILHRCSLIVFDKFIAERLEPKIEKAFDELVDLCVNNLSEESKS